MDLESEWDEELSQSWEHAKGSQATVVPRNCHMPAIPSSLSTIEAQVPTRDLQVSIEEPS